MSAFQDLEQKCVDLGLSAAGPKALISLLAERASWREDKLEEAYYKETNVTFKVGPSASLWSETLLTTVVYDLSLVSQQP